MGTHFLFAVVITVIFRPAPLVSPDDPRPPESLPTPQPLITEVALEHIIMDIPPLLPYERINRYDVWQYVAPDRTGRFRARVIYSPFGAYYLYNGAPYPFTATRTLDFMPYATD